MPICDNCGFESKELFTIGQNHLCALCYPKTHQSGHGKTKCHVCGATSTITHASHCSFRGLLEHRYIAALEKRVMELESALELRTDSRGERHKSEKE